MDYTTELFKVASREFLFLSAFRQKVRKGIKVDIDDAAHDLEEIFREQGALVRGEAKLEALYERARYPLVVLADEILLHTGWEFSPQWQDRIFEEKYFRTNVGGDQYFAIAKELRAEDVELAAIVFAGLALGFRGKFRERPEKLAETRSNVYRLLSEYVASAGDKLTPDAYHIQAGPPKRINPAITLARVAIVGVGGLLLYYLVTFLLWASLLSDIRTAASAMGITG
jgi:type IV/VI secretion system ImpK/VasF family protein